MMPDLPGSIGCSLWGQNCPPGEKCMPFADDGGGAWNALRCAPVVADPAGPGDACTAEGNGLLGLDSCDAQSMCFNLDENLEGECVSHCVGSENNPYCNQPDHFCSIGGEGILALCIPTCNPLLGDCETGEACVPVETGFVCAPDASGPDAGVAGDPCEFVNACDPGLLCANAADVLSLIHI